MKKKSVYVVIKGHKPGVYEKPWSEVRQYVSGYSRKFSESLKVWVELQNGPVALKVHYVML